MSKIYVTKKDHQRLNELLLMQRGNNGNSKYVSQLSQELKRASRVKPEDILECIVTMNSRVRLRQLKTDKEFEITLVYPQDVNVNERKVSVLAPVGIAILGCKEGDVVELPVPTGSTISYVIDKVIYQPEAAGDFHL